MIKNQNLELSKSERLGFKKMLNYFPAEREARYIQQNIDRCLFDARYVAKKFANKKVLNVGGAPFIFEVMLEHINTSINITSIDLHPEHYSSQIEALNLDVICCDIETADGRDKVNFADYDVLCVCEVFEHMRLDLLGTFESLHSKMKAGSFLYLTTPNFFYLPNILGLIYARRSGPSLPKQWGKLAAFGHMGHVREYSQVEVKEFLEYCGFETIEIIPRNTKKYNSGKNPIKAVIKLFSEIFSLFSNDFVILVKKN